MPLKSTLPLLKELSQKSCPKCLHTAHWPKLSYGRLSMQRKLGCVNFQLGTLPPIPHKIRIQLAWEKGRLDLGQATWSPSTFPSGTDNFPNCYSFLQLFVGSFAICAFT